MRHPLEALKRRRNRMQKLIERLTWFVSRKRSRLANTETQVRIAAGQRTSKDAKQLKSS